MKFVYRDYWDKGHNPYTNNLHDLNDEDVCQLPRELHCLWPDDLKDGDEIEITITKTGSRPFGDRRIVLQRPHIYEPETDEQLAERVGERKE